MKAVSAPFFRLHHSFTAKLDYDVNGTPGISKGDTCNIVLFRSTHFIMYCTFYCNPACRLPESSSTGQEM